MREIGIYIHIPFCMQKCLYCDFLSFTNKEKYEEKYIKSLIKEIEKWKEKNTDEKIKTVYIGGGTPSYINSSYIAEIMQKLDLKDAEEITIEANPGSITKEKLEIYKKSGINRISIGLQSTNNELLKKIGRIHTFEEFMQSYKLAKQSGFSNINIDLMIGLPSQAMWDVKEELKEIIKLEPTHISVYSLIVEKNTKLEKMIKDGALKLLDEDLERKMYWYVKNTLERNGYEHYEISNFARKGFSSKHNLDCWSQKEYRGFGVGAHSYIGNRRFSNVEIINEYIDNIENCKFEKNIIVHEIQEHEEKIKEYMLLNLRKIKGVSIKNFKKTFKKEPFDIFKEELGKLLEEDLLILEKDNIRLSEKGIDLANLVWREFC